MTHQAMICATAMADQRTTRSAATETPNAPEAPEHEITRTILQRIGRRRYDMWFARSVISCEGDAVSIATDSPFATRWIQSNFAEELRAAVQQCLGRSATINVHTVTSKNGHGESKDGESLRHSSKQDTKAAQRYDRHGDSSLRYASSDSHKSERRPRSTQCRPMTTAQARQLRNLDDFVVGTSNELAYAAACQIADHHDSMGCSPLLVHGPCGVGKTHLLQGICRRVLASGQHQQPSTARIRYVTAEQFTNEYIAAVQQNRLDAFRREVRNLRLLAIDDMHFLSNKSRTQTEFLHTLDAIDLNGSRVVIASDNHPRRMKQLNQALVSRLLSGMVVEVGLPDERMRVQIIESLAKQRGMRMTESAVRALAQRCTGSVRELEGALTKIKALWTLQKVQMTRRSNGHSSDSPDSESGKQSVEQIGRIVIEQLFADPAMMAGPVHMNRIIEVVCRRLAVQSTDLTGNGRHSRIVLARGLIAALGREMTTMSFPEIARAMGRRNHSTVHTASNRIRKQVAANQALAIEPGGKTITINELLDQLRSAIRQRRDH